MVCYLNASGVKLRVNESVAVLDRNNYDKRTLL
jgi:hypothetical protein